MEQWTPAKGSPRKASKNDSSVFVEEENMLNNIPSETSLDVPIDDADDRAPLLAFAPEEEESDSNEASLTNWEKFAFGSISTRVYKAYAKALGYVLAASVLISLTLMQGK